VLKADVQSQFHLAFGSVEQVHEIRKTYLRRIKPLFSFNCIHVFFELDSILQLRY
jgi:hypothetical protein